MRGSIERLDGKRILLVGRSEAHFTYYASIIEALIDAGAQVSLWYVEGWTDARDGAIREFRQRHPGFAIDWVPRRGDRLACLAFAIRELRSYAWYLRRPDASPFYVARWLGYQPAPLRRMLAGAFGRWLLANRIAELGFELLERILPASPDAVERLRRHPADAIVVSPSNMRFSEEVEYVKAARRLGIPVAVLVQTWDSLTTKGLLHVVPDILLAWHRQHREAAVRLHAVADDRIRIVGAPFFDKWLITGGAPVAEPPPKPFVLYLGSSRNIAADESWVVRDLKRALENHWHPAVRRLEVVVRPHPANAKPFRATARPGVSVVDTALPQNLGDALAFRTLASGALAVVGINTSGMIDSVILDCPTIAIRLDEYRDTQAEAPHFHAMVDSGAVFQEPSFEAVGNRLLELWQGVDRGIEGRRAFRRDMIWPAGERRTAGESAARAVASLIRDGVARGMGRRLLARTN